MREYAESNRQKSVILPSVSLLFALQQRQPATEADTIMAAYHSPAPGAFPLLFLLL